MDEQEKCHEWVPTDEFEFQATGRHKMWRIGPTMIAHGYCPTCGTKLHEDGTEQTMVPAVGVQQPGPWQRAAEWLANVVWHCARRDPAETCEGCPAFVSDDADRLCDGTVEELLAAAGAKPGPAAPSPDFASDIPGLCSDRPEVPSEPGRKQDATTKRRLEEIGLFAFAENQRELWASNGDPDNRDFWQVIVDYLAGKVLVEGAEQGEPGPTAEGESADWWRTKCDLLHEALCVAIEAVLHSYGMTPTDENAAPQMERAIEQARWRIEERAAQKEADRE